MFIVYRLKVIIFEMVKNFGNFKYEDFRKLNEFQNFPIELSLVFFLYRDDFKMIIAYVFGDLDLRDIERYSEKALGIRGYSGY